MQQYVQTLEGRILSLEHQQTTMRSDLQTAIRNMPQSSTPGIYQAFNKIYIIIVITHCSSS
jgi:hypothetical protein